MILFSPVGTADPITALGDGPMLHIVRHYRPTTVSLFLSPVVAAYQRRDGRYTKAIQRLVPGTEVRVAETEQTQVHRFDLFVPEFRAQLAALAAEFPGEQILLNTSSGTPAMQSALVAINAFGIPATRAIQVGTPSRAMNNPGDRESPDDYDLELMWEANDDNLPGSVNRCFEATSAALGAMLERQNIKQLLNSHDYAAANTLAAQARLPRSTKEFIMGVTCRANLDHATAQRLLGPTAFAYRADPAAEYVAAFDLLRRRKQWADFARAATPAIDAALMSAVARDLPEVDQLTRDGQLDRRKLERAPEIRDVLRRRLDSQSTALYLSTADRLDLLAAFAPDTHRVLEPLGRFARRVRNTAAHEIVAITHKKLQEDGGLSAKELVDILARETGADLTIYDRLNAEAIGLIDQAPLG